jgi:katanin p60 ATPase-containing subunit A1
MNHKIAGKIRDEIKNIHKDEISKDLVAMCDFEETQRSVSKGMRSGLQNWVR